MTCLNLEQVLKEALAFAGLPVPVVKVVEGYHRVLEWKLASTPPSIAGPLVRVSDMCVELAEDCGQQPSGPWMSSRAGFVLGNTPLSWGQHAWRVTVDGLGVTGASVFLGVVQSGQDLRGHPAYLHSSFYGVATLGEGGNWAAGKPQPHSGLGRIRSGDWVDLLVDVESGTLTAATPKDGKRLVMTGLPVSSAGWVPCFHLSVPGSKIIAQVIAPEDVGSQERTGTGRV